MKKFICTIITFLLILNLSYAIDNCIEIKNVKVEKISENKAIISYCVQNITDSYQSDIYQIFSLRKFSESGKGYTEIIKTFEPQKVSLYPNEKQFLVFALDYPEIIPEGHYAIYLENDTRTYIAIPPTFVATLPIYGNHDFTFVPNGGYSQSYYFTKPEDALTGPSFNSNTSPVAKISLHSNATEETTLIPQVTLYKRSMVYLSEPILTTQLEPVTLKANQNKVVELKLPKQSEPESYLAKVVFVDENNKQQSYEYFFRYVIKGESGKIISLNPSYNKETNMVDFELICTSSPDGSELKNSMISYSVYENGKVILNETEAVAGFIEKYTVNKSFPYKKDTAYQIKASIYKGKNIFDEYTVNIPKNFDVTPNNIYFIDTIDTYYETSARLLSGLKFIAGYPDSTFKPKNNITRAEMVVVASRLFDKKACDSYIASKTTFTDTSSHWARNYIEFAAANGIVSGYPDGTFKPNANVTYQEAITILVNTIGLRNTALSQEQTWPKNYIDLAYRMNITYELSEDKYTIPAIRGEVADMTLNAFLRKEN